MPIHRFAPAAFLAAAVLALLPASPAWAHNELRSSTPADGAALAEAPREVSLTFAEALNDRFTQIVVTNADRAPVSTDAPSVSGPTGTVTLPADLADGRYTAAYRIVSQDGHPVQGAIRFTVGTVPSPTPAAAAVAEAPRPAPSGPNHAAWWLAAALVVLVVGGLLLLRRRVARR